MATEDFSFPTITTTSSSRFIDSPPLWRLSSTAKRKEKQVEEEDDVFAPKLVANHNQRKSFSYAESRLMKEKEGGSEDDEEKMDLLWEDFNEELYRRNCSNKRPADSDTTSSDDHMVELGCVKALTVSKAAGSSAMLSARRPGVVVLMKVLKKLFLLHNSQRSLRKD